MTSKIKKPVGMMLALLIAVSLFVFVTVTASTAVDTRSATGSAATDSFKVNLTSNLFKSDEATYYYSSKEGVPSTVTITCYMDVDRALKLQAAQFSISYDPACLTFDPDKNGEYDADEEEYDYSRMFPVADGVGDVDPRLDRHLIKFAAAKWDGFALKNGNELVPIATVVFDVAKGANGEANVSATVAACSLTNPRTEEDYVIFNVNGLQQDAFDFVTGGDPATLYAVIEPEGNEPTTEEPTTEEPTTEEPTTEEPTTEEPTTEEPTTEEPTTEEPTTEDNTVPAEDTTAPMEETTNVDGTAGTASTDATSAAGTTGASSTFDQSTPDSGSGGFVQTGNASMAVIILLVLTSATAGIWFVRKRYE